jgi:hypothetical protein
MKLIMAAVAGLVVAVTATVIIVVQSGGTSAPMVWPSTVVTPATGPPVPLGQPADAWRIAFGDEFEGAAHAR